MKKRYPTLACVLALAGCDRSAEIGIEICSGFNVRCQSEFPVEADWGEPLREFAVTPESLVTVTPKSLLPVLAENKLLSYELASDRAGTLWEFGVEAGPENDDYTGEDHLRVRTSTLAGDVQEGAVEAPGLLQRLNTRVLGRAHNSQRGPIVDLSWVTTKCPPDWGGLNCGITETLSFGSDLSMPPERTLWSEDGREAPDFSAQAKGLWISVDMLGNIEQRSSALELVWRQTALNEAQLVVNYNESRPYLLESGELTLLAAEDAVAAKLHGAADQLWRIGFDGNVKQRLAFRPGLDHARLAHDTRNRALVAGTDDDGGMRVLRLDGDKPIQSWTFLRTQYADVVVLAMSVDLAGTLYLLTESGGRAPQDRVPVICRLREDDRSDCVVTTRPAEAMGRPLNQVQATEPGVVYVSDGQRLFRYELPNE
jgi:hypothetical protein